MASVQEMHAQPAMHHTTGTTVKIAALFGRVWSAQVTVPAMTDPRDLESASAKMAGSMLTAAAHALSRHVLAPALALKVSGLSVQATDTAQRVVWNVNVILATSVPDARACALEDLVQQPALATVSALTE